MKNSIPVRQVGQSAVEALNSDSISQIDAKIPVGISACLLGQTVRYNGGHSQSRRCMEHLSEYFRYLPFCPEVAAGFGVPRPTMRLVGDPQEPQLQWSKGGAEDLSEQLQQGFQQQLANCMDLDGYILMKNSPSCGLERINVYRENGHPHKEKSAGLFTRALRAEYPLLPVEEEGRLNDPRLLENFILRVYAHRNFRREVLAEQNYHALMCFHRDYKYLVMAHSYGAYRKLGRMLAESHDREIEEVAREYATVFFAALSKPASQSGHANALLHLLGYLKKVVAGSLRQHIVQVIDDYRQGRLPLITPVTLLQHHIDRCGNEYVRSQRYLQPYPDALGLRSRI